MKYIEPGLKDVYLARKNIKAFVWRTPLIQSPWLSEYAGSNVHLKLESLQNTGSFKLRGATNKLSTLTPQEKSRGVITVSSGNHGRAVSYISKKLGIKPLICVSKAVPRNKVDAIRDLDAEIVITGNTYDEATEDALVLEKERGLTMVHPFDDFDIIAGQGTIGLELIEDLPEIDTVLVPLSGGGLLSGIAMTLKSIKPSVYVVGVTMDQGAAVHESLKAGRIIAVEEKPTLADALAGGLGDNNIYTFRMIQKYVDETVLVTEDEIAEAMLFLLDKHNLVVEGAGAVGIAALKHNKIGKKGGNIAVVITGSNLDLSILEGLLRNRPLERAEE
jgi:threonine dehydratase